MAKFILLLNGPATPMEQMDAEASQKVMQAWDTWMRKVGPAIVDMGQPMGKGTAVVDDGSTRPALEVSGYSIIEAEDMNAALSLMEGHPFLTDKSGKFSVEVYELLPIPQM